MKNKLGEELWKLIETPQGYSFICDDIEEIDDINRLLTIAKIALSEHIKCKKILEKFIDKILIL